MTDRHTHTHRHTDKPSGEVKNIIPFFKGIIINISIERISKIENDQEEKPQPLNIRLNSMH